MQLHALHFPCNPLFFPSLVWYPQHSCTYLMGNMLVCTLKTFILYSSTYNLADLFACPDILLFFGSNLFISFCRIMLIWLIGRTSRSFCQVLIFLLIMVCWTWFLIFKQLQQKYWKGRLFLSFCFSSLHFLLPIVLFFPARWNLFFDSWGNFL